MRAFLEDYSNAKPWLIRAGFRDPVRAHRNFLALADRGLPVDLLEAVQRELEQYLPLTPDPDMAFNNIERLVAQSRSPLSFITFLLRKPHSLAILLQLFSSSQYFSDVIVRHPEYFDFLWEHGRERVDPKLLTSEILGEITAFADDDAQAMSLIRLRRQREILRIGFRDIILGEPLESITRSLSDLADSLAEAALAIAYRRKVFRHGEPRGPSGALSRLVVLGMGKLGGRELNYSSDIDLILVYDHEGQTDGRDSLDNGTFFSEVIQDLVRLLSASTADGMAYRVDLRLRPHGHQSPLCMSLASTLAYYDRHGRTWERQALVKVRPIAGSANLGHEFVRAIEPFIYRTYLSHVEINEIKAIKRRIEAKTRGAGTNLTDLKTGHGGIRDIEFITQFLQLLHGGRNPELRERNTQTALKRLVARGCITPEEYYSLESAYRFLRKAEHRLQFMFDLQTHRIPDSADELDRLAMRLGYSGGGVVRPSDQFLGQLRSITDRNREILSHFMLDLFPKETGSEEGIGEPETDLLMDPNPETAVIENVLGRYRFTDVQKAYRNLSQLAEEEVPFLSSVRCRHFLAHIAPRLLQALADAPDPDMALVNLEKVSASLGAKGVLWESFSYDPAFLLLYVNLCAWSQFLAEILINNPGMIDELLDSLVMNRSPTLEEMRVELDSLLKGARDIDPILHGFKSTRLLGIGVRDILGKQTLPQTAQQLSDLAEAILGAIANLHWNQLTAEVGIPVLDDQPQRPAWYVFVALGKFGGREMSYHSDVDLLLIYEGDGKTVRFDRRSRKESVNNFHFYTELAQRIVRTAGQMGPLGRLYEIDLRLRPTGRSGSLVVPLKKFQEYYSPGGGAALWERMALTRSRIVHGDSDFGKRVHDAIFRAVCIDWEPSMIDAVADMRKRLEASRTGVHLKRSPGGIVDIEFAVQVVQIKYGRQWPQILCPNVWDCLDRIREAGLWAADRVQVFRAGYSFLRNVESRLRIVHNISRDDLPENPADRRALAYRLGYEGDPAGQHLLADLENWMTRIRKEYLACLQDQRTAS